MLPGEGLHEPVDIDAPSRRSPARFAERTREMLGAGAVALFVGAALPRLIACSGSAEDRERLTAAVDGTGTSDPLTAVVAVLDGADHHYGWLAVRWDSTAAAAVWRDLLPLAAETAIPVLSDVLPGPPIADLTPPSVATGQLLARVSVEAEDFASALRGVTAALAPVLDCAKVGIALWSDERRFLQTLPGSFGGSDAYAASSQVTEKDISSGAVRVWTTGTSEFTNDAGADRPGQRPWAEAVGIRQLVTVPLTVGRRRIGVLHAANPADDFDAASVKPVEAFAPFVAGCVAAVRDRLETRRLRAMTDTISGIATAAVAGRGFDALTPSAFAEFCRTGDVRLLTVVFADDRAPRVVVRNGAVPAELEQSFLAEAAQPRVAVRSRLRRPRAVNDAGWSAIHVPVVADGRTGAVLSLLRVPGTPFNVAEQRVVRRLAEAVSLAWLTVMYQDKREQAARVEERQRIADDLHDRVAQILFSAELTLQNAVETLAQDAPVLPALVKARDLLVRSEVSLREAIHQIAPPEGATFAERLRAAASTVATEFDVDVRVDVPDELGARGQRIPQSGAGAEVLVRAAREAMVNAAKHSRARRITLALRLTATRVRVSVDDDGTGITDQQVEGYGLTSLRRSLRRVGASLRISAPPGGGTRLSVSLPLDPPR